MDSDNDFNEAKASSLEEDVFKTPQGKSQKAKVKSKTASSKKKNKKVKSKCLKKLSKLRKQESQNTPSEIQTD